MGCEWTERKITALVYMCIYLPPYYDGIRGFPQHCDTEWDWHCRGICRAEKLREKLYQFTIN